MSMYCIQVNKLLEKTKNPKSKNNLYVVLGYGNQKRRTTSKAIQRKGTDIHIWYESFLFVVDNDEKKNITKEKIDRNNKTLIFSETIQKNRGKMIHKNTKYLDIQHGLINYETDEKNIKFERENKNLKRENESLSLTQIKLTKNIESISRDLANMKMLVQNITDLIDDEIPDE